MEAELTSKDIAKNFSESVMGNIGIKKEFSLTEDILSLSKKPEIPKEKPKKSHKKFKCPKCDWRFAHLQNYKRHIERSKLFNEPKVCNLCNFSSCTPNGLGNHKCLKSQRKIHLQTQVIQRPFEQKNLMEETSKSLEKHKCPNCDWKFSELGKYNRHMESSKKFDKPKKCARCNFSSCIRF